MIQRLLLILCLSLTVKMQLVDYLFQTGKKLAMMGNLPHRSLGMLHAAHVLAPHRADIAYQYCIEWLMIDKSERLLEGQRRPVVPMYIVKLSARFPRDPDFRIMRTMVMHDHLTGKSTFNYPEPEMPTAEQVQ